MLPDSELIIKKTPSLEEFHQILVYGLRRKYTILFVSECEVYYEGRSRSYLESGDRIVIIKKDRSVLIHRSRGYKPVNWQPSGTQISIKSNNNKLIVSCIRVYPREKIEIVLHKIYMVMVAKLVDAGKFHMYMTEEEMKNIVYKNISELIEDGMRAITTEKELKSGKIDILARDRNGNYVVIELKKGRASERDVLQLNRYVSELRETNQNIRGMLVSPSIDTKALEIMRNLNLEYKKVTFRELMRYID